MHADSFYQDCTSIQQNVAQANEQSSNNLGPTTSNSIKDPRPNATTRHTTKHICRSRISMRKSAAASSARLRPPPSLRIELLIKLLIELLIELHAQRIAASTRSKAIKIQSPDCERSPSDQSLHNCTPKIRRRTFISIMARNCMVTFVMLFVVRLLSTITTSTVEKPIVTLSECCCFEQR